MVADGGKGCVGQKCSSASGPLPNGGRCVDSVLDDVSYFE